MQTSDIIIEFAVSHHEAKDNPQLLNDGYTQLCVKRMERIGVADQQLFTCDRTTLPSEAIDFLEANEDRGCSSCWLSAYGAVHSECKSKIDRWFHTRDALISFGLSLKEQNEN